MFENLKRLFNRPILQVKTIKIKKPKKDEMLLFKFKSTVSQEQLAYFKELLSKTIENNKSYIIFNSDVDIIFSKKEKINWKNRLK